MWSIINHTPYKAESTWGRDKDGVHEWIVAVKGTYDIKPDGNVVLAEEQLEPLLAPEYHGEPGVSSLRYDADLVGAKPTTDVIVNGTAYAPKGRPSINFVVSLRIGPIEKFVRVLGNRQWKRGLVGLRPSSAEPITTIPITYERAYGGYDQTDPDPKNQRMDSRNPVGCGVVSKSAHRLGQQLPNFEYPKGNVQKTGPAGFGAIDCYWSPRRELMGTYDKAWQQHRLPLLPKDWDPRSMLCSPPDQRSETFLSGGEVVVLQNFTADGLLRFTLPSERLTFCTRFNTRAGGITKEHASQLATVIIEPDFPKVILVWQSTLTCPSEIDYLEETIIDQVERS